MNQRQIVLCTPVRTAIGTYGGGLKSVPATDLGATVVRLSLIHIWTERRRSDRLVQKRSSDDTCVHVTTF